MTTTDTKSRGDTDDFASQAEQPSPGLVREFFDFLKYN